MYLKDATGTFQPWLSPVQADLHARRSTSRSRGSTSSRSGYDIVANFGDQFSDLNGGFADQTFKVPNPMYFLP